LNQSTHSSVAISMASRLRHGPRRRITSVLTRAATASSRTFCALPEPRGRQRQRHADGRGGANRIEGGDGRDRIDGGGGPDLLLGGMVNDTLIAGSGNDTLRGGLGHHVVTGGGADIFVFEEGPSGVHSLRITDFDGRRGDRIDFESIAVKGGGIVATSAQLDSNSDGIVSAADAHWSTSAGHDIKVV